MKTAPLYQKPTQSGISILDRLKLNHHTSEYHIKPTMGHNAYALLRLASHDGTLKKSRKENETRVSDS